MDTLTKNKLIAADLGQRTGRAISIKGDRSNYWVEHEDYLNDEFASLFTDDLEWCACFEAAFNDEDWASYMDCVAHMYTIRRVTTCPEFLEQRRAYYRFLIGLNAEDRSEAYLRMIGKWPAK